MQSTSGILGHTNIFVIFCVPFYAIGFSENIGSSNLVLVHIGFPKPNPNLLFFASMCSLLLEG